MIKRIIMTRSIFITFFFILNSMLTAQTPFAYISYHSLNIGDDIQALAAKQFLPEHSIGIEREFIGEFEYDQPIKTIVNGWYIHTKKLCWYQYDKTPPKKSWPPSSSIDPLLISIHFTDAFLEDLKSPESVEYLKAHAPIGARDYHTLSVLQELDIPSYFSGCLTLTLANKESERDDIIYAIDLDDKSLEYLRKIAKYRVKCITHVRNYFYLLKDHQRLEYAQSLINLYSRAKCVVTSRFHASMPCLGLETPVLLIGAENNTRFDGMRELVHHSSVEEFISGKADYDVNNPPENPKYYQVIRENLINIVNQWVEDHAK